MVFDRKEYIKEWRENNKEHIKEWGKQYYQANKEHKKEYDKQRYQENKEHLKESNKKYLQTPSGKKNNTIKNWKRWGLKLYGYTYDEVYEYYLETTHCEVCNKLLTKNQKCMDHCHTDGCFRWVLCSSCNTLDNWMTKI